jgi:Tfp pilus assembly protein PilV
MTIVTEGQKMDRSNKIMTAKRPIRRVAGFTVLEVLVATIILMVGIIGVSDMVPKALDSDLRNRDTSSAIMASQMELEQLLRLPIDVNQLATPTDYSFTDADGFVAYVGAIPNPATAAVTAAPPPAVQSGCPLTSNGMIDFGQPCTAAGYTKTVTPTNIAGVATPTSGPSIELRWSVITSYGNDNGTIKPVLKRIAIAGRTTDGALTIPATLNVMVAP